MNEEIFDLVHQIKKMDQELVSLNGGPRKAGSRLWKIFNERVSKVEHLMEVLFGNDWADNPELLAATELHVKASKEYQNYL
jgi:hypothetical protein